MSAWGEAGQIWCLRLFGGFELNKLPANLKVKVAGKRERVLLAHLALSPNFRQPRRNLARLLWGEAGAETYLDNLRVCAWSLRKALGDEDGRLITTQGEDIVLNGAVFQTDVLAFRQLAAGTCRAELEKAAQLCDGKFLDGLDIETNEFESWRREEATRCDYQALGVLDQLMTVHAEAVETERAIEIGTRILRLEPLHESAVRCLMRLYAGSGLRGTAIQIYRRLEDALKSELGAEPEPETKAVFGQLASDGARALTRPAAAVESTEAVPIVDALTSTSPQEPAAGLRLHRPIQLPWGKTVHLTTRRLAWAAAACGATVLVVFLYGPWSDTTTPVGLDAAKAAASSQARAISIAVLPFVNMSGDPEQEFFSDGITEEITATLAKIPDLKIVARTSAFQFKAQNRDIQSIGRQLHATHLIEGSVRHDGNRVRITAQLIAAETGVKVSSESYDRQISDIFATQEDIARTIVGALMAPLVLAPGERLVSNWGIDAESYQQFLRAKALVRARGQVRPAWELTDAAALLKPIVVRYPKFAPAWAQLALIYERLPAGLPANITIGDRRRAAEQWLGKAEAAAEHAIELDAKLPDGYSALGLVMTMRGRFLRAEELLSKALAVDPFYPEALHTYANLLSAVGRHKEALATREQITSIEPFVQVYQSNLFGLLWINGQTDALSARLKDTRAPNGRSNLAFFARMAAAEGHYSEAADILKSMPRNVYPDGMLDDAIRLLRTAPSAPVSPQTVPRLDASLDFAYLHVSDEPIFQSLEQAVAAGYLPPINMVMIWQPAFATLRRTERFKAFARDYGLVDYWRTKGWPSECRPVGVDDFECH